MKITKDSFKEEFKVFISETCLNLRKAHRTYKDDNAPSFFELFENSNQFKQDLTKAINPLILNFIRGYIRVYKGVDVKNEKDKSDITYNKNDYEAKITYAENNVIKSWTGSRYSSKTPKHILIGYTINKETIDSLFIGVIDLDQTTYTDWRSGVDYGNSAYANLKIARDDANKMHILFGHKKPMRDNAINQYFLTEKL
jgi:hypothetical protein